MRQNDVTRGLDIRMDKLSGKTLKTLFAGARPSNTSDSSRNDTDAGGGSAGTDNGCCVCACGCG